MHEALANHKEHFSCGSQALAEETKLLSFRDEMLTLFTDGSMELDSQSERMTMMPVEEVCQASVRRSLLTRCWQILGSANLCLSVER